MAVTAFLLNIYSFLEMDLYLEQCIEVWFLWCSGMLEDELGQSGGLSGGQGLNTEKEEGLWVAVKKPALYRGIAHLSLVQTWILTLEAYRGLIYQLCSIILVLSGPQW